MTKIVDVPIGGNVRFPNRPELGIWRRIDDTRGLCRVRLITPEEPEIIQLLAPGESIEVVDHLVDELLREADDM